LVFRDGIHEEAAKKNSQMLGPSSGVPTVNSGPGSQFWWWRGSERRSAQRGKVLTGKLGVRVVGENEIPGG